MSTLRRVGRWSAGLGGGLLLLALLIFRPDRALQVAAGLTAHTLCSAAFISRFDPAAAFQEHVRTVLGSAAGLVRFRVDAATQSVQASALGVFRARARYTPGYGCRLDHPENTELPAAAVETQASNEDSNPATVSDPLIAAAINAVFSDSPGAAPKQVKAVVILKNGRLIAERYAQGVDSHTPLLSYSVAKSFTNALFGILVRDGRLQVNQPVGAEEWAQPDDARAKITLEDLLRMQSGMDAAETGSGFDPVARMEFIEPDMAGYAARRRLKLPPGREWEYTSANTLILDRVLGRTIGGGAAGLRAFAERELFAPLGMQHVTLEFDGQGVFIGSTFLYATARDYARFGELYRNDGVAPDGRRILPVGWVQWSRRSTLGEPYGAGFWTNDGGSPITTRRAANGFPQDGYFASGFLGQRIYIVPSAALVIVRLGYSAPPSFGISDDIDLIAAAIRATR
jgi:CubicO group peptidase (beta-lactamase class C family)